MKIDPLAQSNLKEYEIYLMNFWKPKKGDIILYGNNEYKIDTILKDAESKETSQVRVGGLDDILWLQDVAWRATMNDIDEIVRSYGGEILNDTIHFNASGKKCYFSRPSDIEEYVKIFKDIRIYYALNREKSK